MTLLCILQVIRIWNSASDSRGGRGDGGRGGGAGRGRGRGRHSHTTDHGEGGHAAQYDEKEGMWDDDFAHSSQANNDKGDSLDLADFAAATLKFSSEARRPGAVGQGTQVDTMDDLLREQNNLSKGLEDDSASSLWEDVNATGLSQQSIEGTGNQRGRSLLLEVCNTYSYI